MKCHICGMTGFKRDELVDYHGDGKLFCGPCADEQDIIDKNEEWEEDEDQPGYDEMEY